MNKKTSDPSPAAAPESVPPSAEALELAGKMLGPLFANNDPNDPVIFELQRLAALAAARHAGKASS